MKLYIDDIRNAPDNSWNIARTVTTAINFIYQFGEKLTHISLDHDISYQLELNGISRPYPSPETFKAVAAFIAIYYKQNNAQGSPYPHVTIHSSNPVGAESIKSILQEGGFIDIDVVPAHAANRLEMEL